MLNSNSTMIPSQMGKLNFSFGTTQDQKLSQKINL